MKGYQRKCRNCSKWAVVDGKVDELLKSACPFCGKGYGKFSLGDDVPLLTVQDRHRAESEEKREAESIEAMRVRPPTVGEYGFRRVSPLREGAKPE